MTDTFQSIGAISNRLVNRWAWWQAALKGNFGRIHSEPQQGYYRTRKKDGPWEPVAIWWDEEVGGWLAYRNGRDVQADDIWTWACRNPITHEAYEKALAGGGFDDEPQTAAPAGHNSGDADPFEALKIELAGEAEMAGEFLKAEVKTQAQADKAGIWAKRMTDLAKRADNLRVVEKEPHLAASRAVDDKWRDPITDAKDWASNLKRHIEPFLIAEKRKKDEEARKAREEAERQRKEAAEAKDEEQRAEALQRAQEAEKQAESTKNASAGRTGARVSIRVEKVGVVTDYAKAAAALVAMKHPDFLAEIDRLAKAAAKKNFPFDGMEIKDEERVV